MFLVFVIKQLANFRTANLQLFICHAMFKKPNILLIRFSVYRWNTGCLNNIYTLVVLIQQSFAPASIKIVTLSYENCS